MRLFLIPLVMLLPNCSTLGIDKEATDSALCSGLEVPVEEFSQELLDQQEKTPTGVILKGSKIVRIYDAGCK